MTKTSRRVLSRLGLAAVLATGAAGISACGSDDKTTTAATPTSSANKSLTVYSGREEELVAPLYAQFAKATGIKVKARYGDSAELSATIQEEGKNSPADVFFSQDGGALGSVEEKDLLAELPGKAWEKVSENFRDEDDKWVGVSGRARVIAYNTEALKAADVPTSVLDLTDKKWRGKVGIAPTNASFQAFVSAMRISQGDQKTEAWLKALKDNGVKTFEKNGLIVEALDRGEIKLGLVNHYYLFEKRADNPDLKVANSFTKAGDPGSLVNVAGVGVLESSENKDAAQKFVEYLLSDEGQKYFSEKTAEYPLIAGVKPNKELPELSEISTLKIDLGDLGEKLPSTLTMIGDAGFTS